MTETQLFYFWEQVSMRNFSFHTRFCSGIVLAGLAVGIPLAVTVQAQPSNLAYEYQDGSFTADAEINPLAGRLLGRVLKREIPSAVTFSATELAGAFTIPETTTQIGNGSITLDSSPVKAFLEPYLQQALGQVAQSYSLPEGVGIETLESVLNYRFIGQGLLESDNEKTAFTFEYGDDTDSLAITGIDPAVLALCEIQQCNTQVDGNFDLKLDVEGFSETSDELGIQLPSSVKRALRRAKLFGFREVAFADGKLTSVVQVLPNLAPPEIEAESVVPELTVPAEADETSASTTPEAQPPEVIPPAIESDNEVPATSTPEEITPPEASSPETSGNNPILPESLSASVKAAPAQAPLRPRRTAGSTIAHHLTRGNFILTAERLTAPWSMVFAVPSR